MSFYEEQKKRQIEWWKNYTSQPNWENEKWKWGIQNGVSHPHITKANLHKLLWKGIVKELLKYLETEDVQAHSGVKNLLSSWVAAANLYFPTYSDNHFKDILLGFLKSKISKEIIAVESVELEFALEGDLSPATLLGEKDGRRGSGQTSPDIAIIVKTDQKKEGLILIECKYTEHSFYSCSARRRDDRKNKPGNPHPEKCLQSASLCSFEAIPCHQKVWGRKYLDYFKLSDEGKKNLTRCPAASNGYQLLRQQALANGIKKSGKYNLVVSAVSFDGRNNSLISCLKSTGIPDFQTGWKSTFENGADFITWRHQDWVEYVRNHSANEEVKDWLKYIEERYGY